MLDPKQGLYIMAARDIFSMLRKPENQHLSAWIGLYEIYQGQLYDLLNERKKLFAREDGKNNVIISGLKEYPIDNVDKLIQVFDYGSSVRSTGKCIEWAYHVLALPLIQITRTQAAQVQMTAHLDRMQCFKFC